MEVLLFLSIAVNCRTVQLKGMSSDPCATATNRKFDINKPITHFASCITHTMSGFGGISTPSESLQCFSGYSELTVSGEILFP